MSMDAYVTAVSPGAQHPWQGQGVLRAEAMSARCTARLKIPFRISWRSVFSAARAEQDEAGIRVAQVAPNGVAL
jgi:hypothetical protein